MDFSQLALLLVIASIFGFIAKVLKQPLLVGYLVAGLLLSLSGVIHDPEEFEALSQVGVALLLFLLGLEMDLGQLKSVGKAAVLTGVGQIVFTTTIGFALSLLLGFEPVASIYIAIGLAFSSTIIMVKLLSEKNDLDSLYGRIAIGFLLVQDFVAVVILMVLAGMKNGGLAPMDYILLLLKGGALIAVVWLLSRKVIPRVLEKALADSTELLFISSIAWALGVATFVAGPLGFSLEIGGFLAGIALSGVPEHLEIASRTKPLRDFFLTIFFLVLGTKLIVGSITTILVPALVFSVFVLVGNQIIVMTIMGFMGYRKRTSFLAGLAVAQISEFSLILMAMGASLGHTADTDVGMLVMVGVITMTLSSYLIMGADKVYIKIKDYLAVFEHKHRTAIDVPKKKDLSGHTVLVGCDRTGLSILPLIKKHYVPYVVVDFNPHVFSKLSQKDTPVIFGDIADIDIMEAAGIEKAAMVISTINDKSETSTLLEYLHQKNKKAIVVVKSASRREALGYYQKGADYVLVPDILAGEHLRHILKLAKHNKKRIEKAGNSHERRLIKITP